VDSVLGLCLFSGEGYDWVLARVFSDPPTASALSQAHARLAGEPLGELFELTAAAAVGDPTLERLPDTIARLVEFDLLVTNAHGKTKASRYRHPHRLLDCQVCPAKQIAAVYAGRWQAEIAYYRIKDRLLPH
jgi:hypothetical protein